jgi:hypothetical protein
MAVIASGASLLKSRRLVALRAKRINSGPAGRPTSGVRRPPNARRCKWWSASAAPQSKISVRVHQQIDRSMTTTTELEKLLLYKIASLLLNNTKFNGRCRRRSQREPSQRLVAICPAQSRTMAADVVVVVVATAPDRLFNTEANNNNRCTSIETHLKC